MKPNKKHNIRQPAEIMKDLTEARDRFAEAIRSQNYVMIEQFKKRIEMFENELEMAYAFINLCTEKITGDKHLISWGGKMLSLSINEADLAIKHLDMFWLYFKESGYIPKEEWKEAHEGLLQALTKYRRYMIEFFSGDNIDHNAEDMSFVEDTIANKLFTDREMVYFRKYEDKI